MTNKKLVRAINWNDASELDSMVWEKLWEQFWLPERFPVNADLKGWRTMSAVQQDTTSKVFAGLTLLDTVQSLVGAPALVEDSQTEHEKAVYAQIGAMEAVHAKSYSYIFSTLLHTEEINQVFNWTETDPYLIKKEEIILSHYEGADKHKKKVASTLLESYLFYSGFYLPLYWATRGLLVNTNDIIRLILRDEALHGWYIGTKYQSDLAKESPEKQEEMRDFTYSLFYELHKNELEYTQELYDPLGLTEDVKKFLKYNANKAFMNLGYDALFMKEETDANPAVLASLSPNANETHDFFSLQGTGYKFSGKVETTDEDWGDWDD